MVHLSEDVVYTITCAAVGVIATLFWAMVLLLWSE